MQRDKIVVACNWKAYLGIAESISLARALSEYAGKAELKQRVIVAPSHAALYQVGRQLEGTQVELCAQNVNVEANGPFTGALSLEAMKEIGCKNAILGHSEVRSGKSLGIAETDQLISDKFRMCINANINPILCIGETSKERDSGLALDVLRRQMLTGLDAMRGTNAKAGNVLIAYEPVWAISSNGPSRIPDPREINETVAKLKKLLFSEFGAPAARCVKFLYGGSVDCSNVSGYTGQSSIDGVLIGGMSTNKAKIIEMLGKL